MNLKYKRIKDNDGYVKSYINIQYDIEIILEYGSFTNNVPVGYTLHINGNEKNSYQTLKEAKEMAIYYLINERGIKL